MNQLYKSILSLVLVLMPCLLTFNTANAQDITDSLLQKIANRFETQDLYKLKTIIQSVNKRKDGLPPDASTDCISGKEMLVVAVFGAKPKNLFARMVVSKHYNKKIEYDEHPFQAAASDEALGVHYALVRVVFPAEANSLNCGVNLQVYDKANLTAKVWLLVFSKPV